MLSTNRSDGACPQGCASTAARYSIVSLPVWVPTPLCSCNSAGQSGDDCKRACTCDSEADDSLQRPPTWLVDLTLYTPWPRQSRGAATSDGFEGPLDIADVVEQSYFLLCSLCADYCGGLSAQLACQLLAQFFLTRHLSRDGPRLPRIIHVDVSVRRFTSGPVLSHSPISLSAPTTDGIAAADSFQLCTSEPPRPDCLVRETNSWGSVDVVFTASPLRSPGSFKTCAGFPRWVESPIATNSSVVFGDRICEPSAAPAVPTSTKPGFSFGVYRLNIAPGCGIPLHFHHIMQESEMVLSHSLLCQRLPARYGDTHRWGRCCHCYHNPSTDRYQSVLCVDEPAFIPQDEIPVDGSPDAVPATNDAGYLWRSLARNLAALSTAASTARSATTPSPTETWMGQPPPTLSFPGTYALTTAGADSQQVALCFDPTTFRQPHAALVLALDAAGRLLLVRHPQRGWELPGGKLERGESAVQAAVRELEEESGCRASPEELRPIAQYCIESAFRVGAASASRAGATVALSASCSYLMSDSAGPAFSPVVTATDGRSTATVTSASPSISCSPSTTTPLLCGPELSSNTLASLTAVAADGGSASGGCATCVLARCSRVACVCCALPPHLPSTTASLPSASLPASAPNSDVQVDVMSSSSFASPADGRDSSRILHVKSVFFLSLSRDACATLLMEDAKFVDVFGPVASTDRR